MKVMLTILLVALVLECILITSTQGQTPESDKEKTEQRREDSEDPLKKCCNLIKVLK
jgi:hypothetical protein